MRNCDFSEAIDSRSARISGRIRLIFSAEPRIGPAPCVNRILPFCRAANPSGNCDWNCCNCSTIVPVNFSPAGPPLNSSLSTAVTAVDCRSGPPCPINPNDDCDNVASKSVRSTPAFFANGASRVACLTVSSIVNADRGPARASCERICGPVPAALPNTAGD